MKVGIRFNYVILSSKKGLAVACISRWLEVEQARLRQSDPKPFLIPISGPRLPSPKLTMGINNDFFEFTSSYEEIILFRVSFVFV